MWPRATSTEKLGEKAELLAVSWLRDVPVNLGCYGPFPCTSLQVWPDAEPGRLVTTPHSLGGPCFHSFACCLGLQKAQASRYRSDRPECRQEKKASRSARVCGSHGKKDGMKSVQCYLISRVKVKNSQGCSAGLATFVAGSICLLSCWS